MKKIHTSFFAVTLLFTPLLVSAEVVRSIEFPVGGSNYYRDDFGDPRGGGTRTHKGNDIIAPKLTPLVSVIDGRVDYIISPEADWGYEIALVDSEGYGYFYYHVNNDNPGTDDGKGGDEHAYAPGLSAGSIVTRGQLVGWVGDSGNAENTVPHLHFEIHDPRGIAINPYQSLINASGPYKQSTKSFDVTPDTRAMLEYVNDGRPDDIFRSPLEQGSSGNEVRQLQISLKAIGLVDKEGVTGYYGPITRAAVIVFQKRQSIEPLGIVGPQTRAALNQGIASGVLQEYKPYLDETKERAILIQKLLSQIKILQTRLNALQGIR